MVWKERTEERAEEKGGKEKKRKRKERGNRSHRPREKGEETAPTGGGEESLTPATSGARSGGVVAAEGSCKTPPKNSPETGKKKRKVTSDWSEPVQTRPKEKKKKQI